MDFDIDAYLERIGSPSTAGSSEEVLDRVHYAHITHIPFENIDVLQGRGIDISPGAIFDKLVLRRRGGYCFEMNGLFCLAAQAMGMKATGVLARVSRGGENGFGGYSHRMNIVEAGGRRYICDVGFGGDCFTDPLVFELGAEQSVHGCVYRIQRGSQTDYTVQILKDGAFEDMLGFEDRPANEEDFVISNFYTSRHPLSVFRHSLMLNIFTDAGRYSVFENTLTEQLGQEITRRTLTREELERAVEKHFALQLPPGL